MLQGSAHAEYANDWFDDVSDIVETGFSFAFQPIVSLDDMKIVGAEALVRGLAGESAASVIAAIRPENQFSFDQACRNRALRVAARIGIGDDVHLNCSQITPANLETSLAATRRAAVDAGIHPARVVLEFGNLEVLGDPRALDHARQRAQAQGFRVLADNVGVNEVGLKRLAVFKPDFAKLDRSLVRRIETSPRRQAIVLGIIATCRALGIEPIAGGVEKTAERDWLSDAGVRLAQGYLFAQPAFERSPEVDAASFAA